MVEKKHGNRSSYFLWELLFVVWTDKKRKKKNEQKKPGYKMQVLMHHIPSSLLSKLDPAT